MIEGVVIEPRKVFRDDRGAVMHMLRCDDKLFSKFGEIYFSVTNPGIIKGWKKHLKMTQHFTVPRGTMKIVLFDDRLNSPTKGQIQEIIMGENNYQLLRIPAGLWYSFRAENNKAAMITNCSDIPHDPAESVSKPLGDTSIPYHWR